MGDIKNGLLISSDPGSTTRIKRVNDSISAVDVSTESLNEDKKPKKVKVTITMVIENAEIVENFDTDKVKENQVFLEFLNNKSIYLVDKKTNISLQAQSGSTIGFSLGALGGGGKIGGPGVKVVKPRNKVTKPQKK